MADKPFLWTKNRMLLRLLLQYKDFKATKNALLELAGNSLNNTPEQQARLIAYWMRELTLVSKQMSDDMGKDIDDEEVKYA